MSDAESFNIIAMTIQGNHNEFARWSSSKHVQWLRRGTMGSGDCQSKSLSTIIHFSRNLKTYPGDSGLRVVIDSVNSTLVLWIQQVLIPLGGVVG